MEFKQWHTALDERVCNICEGLHGDVVKVDEAFSDGSEDPPFEAFWRASPGRTSTD